MGKSRIPLRCMAGYAKKAHSLVRFSILTFNPQRVSQTAR